MSLLCSVETIFLGIQIWNVGIERTPQYPEVYSLSSTSIFHTATPLASAALIIADKSSRLHAPTPFRSMVLNPYTICTHSMQRSLFCRKKPHGFKLLLCFEIQEHCVGNVGFLLNIYPCFFAKKSETPLRPPARIRAVNAPAKIGPGPSEPPPDCPVGNEGTDVGREGATVGGNEGTAVGNRRYCSRQRRYCSRQRRYCSRRQRRY